MPPHGQVRFRVIPGPSVMYYDSFVYSVKARSRGVTVSAGPSTRSGEHTMIRLALHVSPRPR